MHPMTDVAARLGSRFNLIFDPHGSRVFLNAAGDFRELPVELAVGASDESRRTRILPFSRRYESFEYLEQDISPTSVVFRGISPQLGLQLEMKFLAPFYPQDVPLSTVPCFLVSIRLMKLERFRWEKNIPDVRRATLFFNLNGGGLYFDPERILQVREKGHFEPPLDLRYSFTSRSELRNKPPGSDEFNKSFRLFHTVRPITGDVEMTEHGFELHVDFSTQSCAVMELLWCGWNDVPLLKVCEKWCKPKYSRFFKSEEDVFSWFLDNRERVERLCREFDSLFLDWSLGKDASRLTSLAFHSFLACSWWCERHDGRDWFSVWEGSCYYHSTIDVEYNDAFLYVALWPQLLDILLDEWTEFTQPGELVLGKRGAKTMFLCHDMGSGWRVGEQDYNHHMPVEENVNYLLLVAIRYAMGADAKWLRKKLPLCRKLAEFVVQSDTTGNAFPDVGIANTIDDASPAVQFGKEQIYLAVKSQAALWALSEIEEALAKDRTYAERWKAFVAKGIETLDKTAWLEDHYLTSLTRTTDGLVDPWGGEPLPFGELEGWDAYSIYTANGLLYLLLGGFKLPRWRLERFRKDIEAAYYATLGPYGCSHTSAGDKIVWISQNIWRDAVAAYLELDLLVNVERYWEYQALTGHNYESALFYDTTLENNLNFYPRGAVIFALPLATAGLRMNLRERELTLNPVRSTLSVPLLPFADWERGRVPWLHVRKASGTLVARVTEPELFKGYKIRIEGATLEMV